VAFVNNAIKTKDRKGKKNRENPYNIQMTSGLISTNMVAWRGRGVTTEDMAAAPPRRRPLRFTIEDTAGIRVGNRYEKCATESAKNETIKRR
jgi:hypothetical protein